MLSLSSLPWSTTVSPLNDEQSSTALKSSSFIFCRYASPSTLTPFRIFLSSPASRLSGTGCMNSSTPVTVFGLTFALST